MTSVYYDDLLKQSWLGPKYSDVYEYDIIHGYNCSCCTRVVTNSGNNERRKARK